MMHSSVWGADGDYGKGRRGDDGEMIIITEREREEREEREREGVLLLLLFAAKLDVWRLFVVGGALSRATDATLRREET